MLDQTGASAARLVAGAFPELDEHSTILSLVGEFGFRFGVHSGFLPSALPKHIDSLVNGMFTSSEAGQALSLLNTITDDNTNAEAMRTRLAALRVSAGSLAALGKAVKAARIDYRDVLADAESMHKFVGNVRPLAPGVPDRSTQIFREYVLWLLRHLQPETFERRGPVGK